MSLSTEAAGPRVGSSIERCCAKRLGPGLAGSGDASSPIRRLEGDGVVALACAEPRLGVKVDGPRSVLLEASAAERCAPLAMAKSYRVRVNKGALFLRNFDLEKATGEVLNNLSCIQKNQKSCTNIRVCLTLIGST